MTEWHPTPEDQLIVARIFLGDCWVEREIRTLKPGDVFRMVAPDGQLVHPMTFEPNDTCVSVATAPPRKCTGRDGENPNGYGVPIDVYDTMDDVRAAGFA